MTRYRSAASLMASGVATITFARRLSVPKLKSTTDSLRADQEAMAGDWRRVAHQLRQHVGDR